MRTSPSSGKLALVALVGSAVAVLSACSGLPELPRLPSLPRLPTATEVREAVAPGSSGNTLGDAILSSRVVADVWSTNTATLVDAQGKSIDPGGRNGGYRGGDWTLMWRLPGTEKGLRVYISPDRTSSAPVVVPPGIRDLGGRSLDGLLDSPAALAAANLGNVRATVLLSRAGDRARYNLVSEAEPKFVLLDATTGLRVDP